MKVFTHINGAFTCIVTTGTKIWTSEGLLHIPIGGASILHGALHPIVDILTLSKLAASSQQPNFTQIILQRFHVL